MRDPAIGGFDDVQEMINQDEGSVRRAISTFFFDKKPDDMLLLYFSGHGVLDPQGRLFLAVKNTLRNLLKATAIPASFVSENMDDCRSKRQVLILDCCHSGAFAKGTKGDTPAVTKTTFEGNGFGRVVLTASNSTQYALEGDQVIEQTSLSLFTHYLLDGLTHRRGGPGGGWAGHPGRVVRLRLRPGAGQDLPANSPQVGLQPARRPDYCPQPAVRRLPKPPTSLQSSSRRSKAHSLGCAADAVVELSRLLQGKNPQQTLAAKEALQKLADHDDSRRIAGDAAAILAEYLQTHPVGVPSAPLETAPEPAEPNQSSLPAAAVAGGAVAAKLASAEAAVAQVTPAEAVAGPAAAGQAAAGLAAAGRHPALEKRLTSRRPGRHRACLEPTRRACDTRGWVRLQGAEAFLARHPYRSPALCLTGYGASRGLVVPYLAASSDACNGEHAAWR